MFYGLNGYLLGREFFELVAIRRLPQTEARALRKQKQTVVIGIGAVFAFLMTLPIINLLTPIIATATMLHLFEKWRSQVETALATT